jgi:hypothetical protein
MHLPTVSYDLFMSDATHQRLSAFAVDPLHWCIRCLCCLFCTTVELWQQGSSADRETDCLSIAYRPRAGHVDSPNEQMYVHPRHPQDADDLVYPQKGTGPSWALQAARSHRKSADRADFGDYNVDGFQTHPRTSVAFDFGAGPGHALPGDSGAAEPNPATYTPR